MSADMAHVVACLDRLKQALESGPTVLAFEPLRKLRGQLDALEKHLNEQYQRELTDRLQAVSGNSRTHTWNVDEHGIIECTACPTGATPDAIELGQVPNCSPDERCSLSRHSIYSGDGSGTFTARRGSGICIYCETVYPTTAEVDEPAEAVAR